jgi:hypothetical protein
MLPASPTTELWRALRNGLRNDYDETGKQRGCAAIAAGPWGAPDKCENLYLQRERGNVHIIIAMDVWREHLSKQFYYHKETGVRAFITGAGAVLFANVDPHIATVIPVRVLRGIVMNYPIGDHFAGQMRAAGVQDPEAYVQNLETQYKTRWINMFSDSCSRVFASTWLPWGIL